MNGQGRESDNKEADTNACTNCTGRICWFARLWMLGSWRGEVRGISENECDIVAMLHEQRKLALVNARVLSRLHVSKKRNTH